MTVTGKCLTGDARPTETKPVRAKSPIEYFIGRLIVAVIVDQCMSF